MEMQNENFVKFYQLETFIMECKNCGVTLNDETVFCNNCGARVDGKKSCANCGRLNDENNAFCNFCGARIDGKQTCSVCGATVKGTFCPHCGNKTGKTIVGKKKEGKPLAYKIFDYVGGGTLMIGVLLALIFVFFIGIKGVVTEDGEMLSSSKQNIYYFFGKYYKEAKAIKNGLDCTAWFKKLNSTHIALYGVTGTIISAATLLCVVSFGTVAIVKYILYVTHKTYKKADNWAYACILAFLCGVAMFYLHTRASMIIEEYDREYWNGNGGYWEEEASLFTKFNGTTVVGMVLCLIFTVIGFVFNVVCRGKTLWRGENISKTIFSIFGIAISVAIFTLATNLTFRIKMIEDEVRVVCSLGAMLLNKNLNASFAESSSKMAKYTQITERLNEMNIFNVFAHIFALALIITSAISIKRNMRNVETDKKSNIVEAILSVVFAVSFLICIIIAVNKYKAVQDLLGQELDISGVYGVPIAVVVCSVILLVVSIVGKILGEKFNLSTWQPTVRTDEER